MTDETNKVIDWQEAMDQCGDDEEFLRELLSDLRGEIDAQLVKIEEALQVSKIIICGWQQFHHGSLQLLFPRIIRNI